MGGSHKVLTVSYGAFACTLEGFDDPVATMKEVAEYVRDLAAADGRFGMERPALDAAQIARIAGHRVAGRVEARVDAGGVTLRLGAAIGAGPEMPTLAQAVARREAAPPAPAMPPRLQSLPAPLVQLLARAQPARAAAPLIGPRPEAEAIAAKLRRIRAAVDEALAPRGPSPALPAPAPALAPAPVPPDEALPPEPREAAAVGEDDLDAAWAADVAARSPEEEPAHDAAEGRSEEPADAWAEAWDDAWSQHLSMSPDEAPPDATAESPADGEAPAAAEPATPERAVPKDGETAGEVEAEAVRPMRPRVVRMRRADFDRAIAAGALVEEVGDEAPEAPRDEPYPAGSARHALLADGPDGDEAAISRILSRTDAQLAEPEGSRRRDTIAQLKAAVAATEAARHLGEPLAEAATEAAIVAARAEPFRDDLRQAVRPRRPILGGDRPRPERRAEPLALGAAQRVDLPAEPSIKPAIEPGAEPDLICAWPVRPRRIQPDAQQPEAAGATGPAGGPHAGGFVAFAAERGATSPADLVEAAAAFLALVERVPDFSRPQVFAKVRQVLPGRFSREDGLDIFGTLVRDGALRRVSSGRFQVAAGSRIDLGRGPT